MPWPKPTLNAALIGLLAVLLLSSVFHTRESLLFCEKALYGEMKELAKETKVEKPIRFSDVCPDVRQRAENTLTKWLEVILALMVNLHPPAKP